MRSSCEAVATNARRASSWRRSSPCMAASVRARSPTSSRPVSVGGGASGPSAAIRTAAARRRARRRESVLDSAIPSTSATTSPMPAAAMNALRTWATAASTSVNGFCVTSRKRSYSGGSSSATSGSSWTATVIASPLIDCAFCSAISDCSTSRCGNGASLSVS